MGERAFWAGCIITSAAAGGFVLGAFYRQRSSARCRDFIASWTRSLSRRGFVWSVAAPAGWLLLFYALVAHVRLSLGRWPTFGEPLDGLRLTLHFEATWGLGIALLFSLYAPPVVWIGSWFFIRWRGPAVYALAYAAAVGLAVGSVSLAPAPFVNWFLD